MLKTRQRNFGKGAPKLASEALGASIAQTFQDGCDSVILENHGVVVGGASLSQAYQRFEAFEFAAKTIIKGYYKVV